MEANTKCAAQTCSGQRHERTDYLCPLQECKRSHTWTSSFRSTCCSGASRVRWQAFAADSAADCSCGFQADALASLVFRRLIPHHDGSALVELLEFLQARLFRHLDADLDPAVRKLQVGTLLQECFLSDVCSVLSMLRRRATSACPVLTASPLCTR